METADLLKDINILTTTNGAHASSKEVDGLGASEYVSDLKEPSTMSMKETSSIISKEFSPIPDRKELTPESFSKDESPVLSSKESSPMPLSKESSPQPFRKQVSPQSLSKDVSPQSLSKESSPQPSSKESSPLISRKETLQSTSQEGPNNSQKVDSHPLLFMEDDKVKETLPTNKLISDTEAFLLSESVEIYPEPNFGIDTPLPCTTCDVKEAAFNESLVFPSSLSEVQSNEQNTMEEDPFGFNKPLPPEPIESTTDFLKSESTFSTEGDDIKPITPMVVADDFMTDISDTKDEDKSLFRKTSPSPPPVPKHQNLKDDPSERYEPSQTPEPDFAAFKSVSNIDDKYGEQIDVQKPSASLPKHETESSKSEMTPSKKEEPPFMHRIAVCPAKRETEVIGAKDIRGKIDAWFNPARLHPQVESLIYWRDPKKSGVVFGITMVSLLSLTFYSLISVVAYLCLFILGGTITFRIYKNVMQAVQKTSDGHPFKDLLEIDLTIPEDKVSDVSQCIVQYLNTSLTTLRSLFLVEDLIDSIKFVVLLWVLTYVGACFNGLTLIILGVILLFSLPKVYENNKAQIDVYMKMGMDKLSVITNRMKAAVPEGKKDDKPKDQ